MRSLLLLLVQILALTAASAGLGLAVNALRPQGLPLVQNWTQTILSRYLAEETLSPQDGLVLLRRGQALFVDARDAESFAAGHVPGALSLPYDPFAPDLEQRIRALPKDELLVVYCSGLSCSLGPELADMLRWDGYERVLIMPEGWDGWVEMGGPTQEGS